MLLEQLTRAISTRMKRTQNDSGFQFFTRKVKYIMIWHKIN
jgi:hypothetical protein